MNSEKRALGKGLSALISENVIGINDDSYQSLIEIDINHIDLNPNQPRKLFDEQEIAELADSIKELGLIQPIIVRKLSSHQYQLIAGERRLTACKKAGLSKISAIVHSADSNQSAEIALVENIQRQDLTPLEEATAYDSLIKRFSYTQEALAKKVGKSRSHIANTLRLLNLPEDIKAMINNKKLSAGHARAILNSPNPEELAKKIVNDNLSVRDAENLKKPQKEQNRHKNLIQQGAEKHFTKDSDLLEIETMLSQSLGMKVSINDTQQGGQIVIDFDTLEQLDFIIQRLGSDVRNF
jgi:ParB family chromosome partitioning protein